jgi:CheY-like chemotaxis protein
MPAQPKILLLDDDQDFLDLYREMLSQHLPSMPEVRAANTGARALSLLESEPFTLFVVDLNLSKMDGLQVLTIARRKYPQLRLVVLTGIRDEQFRTRAYALGVDQYWIKPETDQEMGLFMESIEALISREAQAGFRGVQSKSLVDIIQLECLSQSSCMLKITNGVTEGKIYIQNGEVIDSELPGMTAEPAFQRILSWKNGSFETLPPDPTRVRTIFTSYQGLLLNTAQAIDEAASLDQQSTAAENGAPSGAVPPPAAGVAALLADVSQIEGVEFVLALGHEKNQSKNFWGLENPKPVAEFTRQTLENFRSLGERLQVGELQHILGAGSQRKVAVGPCGKSELCVGFPPALSPEQVRDAFKNILTKWAS